MDHPTDPAAAGTASDPAADLERARERLAFYDSFDRLIQDNIARSGDLLRQAMTLRESATQELAEARADLELRAAAAGASQRAVLVDLRDELLELQQRVVHLMRRVGDGIEDLNPRSSTAEQRADPVAEPAEPAGPPAATESVASTSDTDRAGAPGPDPDPVAADSDAAARDPLAAPPVPAPVATEIDAIDAPAVNAPPEPPPSGSASLATADPRAAPWQPPTADQDDFFVLPARAPIVGLPALTPDLPPLSPAPLYPLRIADIAAAAVANGVDPASPNTPPATSADQQAETTPPGVPLAAGDAAAPVAAHATTVLIHGVPRAATALSLQRHLAALDHVQVVEAREYAEGILRLQVLATPPLQLEDIVGWDGGGPIEPLHVRGDVIEVRLPGVGGL